jgi:hypothetical protein
MPKTCPFHQVLWVGAVAGTSYFALRGAKVGRISGLHGLYCKLACLISGHKHSFLVAHISSVHGIYQLRTGTSG